MFKNCDECEEPDDCDDCCSQGDDDAKYDQFVDDCMELGLDWRTTSTSFLREEQIHASKRRV